MGTESGRDERLLDIAERLFIERGLAFSMDDLAREAGASKRTIYASFASKEVLLEAILTKTIRSIEASFEAIELEPGLSAAERLRRLLRGGAGSCSPALNLRLREVERAYPGLYARLSDWSAEGWDYIAQRIEEGARSGAFRTVDKAALELLLAGFHRELAARGFRAAPGLPLEATLESLADILLGGLLPRGPGG